MSHRTFARTAILRRLLVVLPLLFVISACDDDPAAPGIEPEIVNSSESFEFQVSRVSGYSGTLEYTWSNPQTAANLDESISLDAGTVRLTVVDAAGTTLHDADLEDGSMATDTGVAGDWTVRVRFSSARGTVNFRLQPRTP